MVVVVGINGFGRIGRVIFRTCFQNPEIKLSAINDPVIDIEYICYLIRFDSTHGKFRHHISHTGHEITIDDQVIKVFREKVPLHIPWNEAGVQYVVEASGMFTNMEKASGHLASVGVKRVIITAPSVDAPMMILGVNEHTLLTSDKVLSCTSSTLYCLSPMIKLLNDHFGVLEGFITSIHAMTPSLKPLDGMCLRGKVKHWRDHRSIHQNIIPASTGACKALGKIIPAVKEKLTGLAFRVPIVNVSVLDITIRLEASTSIQDIVKTVENASKTNLKNIISISNEDAVSSDFAGESHSCILDVNSSLQLTPNFFKLVCWYENEYSYACRVIDSIFFSEKQTSKISRYSFTKIQQDVILQTESCSEEKSIECKYETQTRMIFCDLNKYGTKSIHKATPLILKKPLSSHISGLASTSAPGREIKKRIELFKIWKDDIGPPKASVRHNRNSLFHSCMEFSPKHSDMTDCVRAQQQLESVKNEFTEMLNITEDLLRKSKIKICNSKEKLKAIAPSLESSEDASKNDKQIYNTTQLKSRAAYRECGDFKIRAQSDICPLKAQILTPNSEKKGSEQTATNGSSIKNAKPDKGPIPTAISIRSKTNDSDIINKKYDNKRIEIIKNRIALFQDKKYKKRESDETKIKKEEPEKEEGEKTLKTNTNDAALINEDKPEACDMKKDSVKDLTKYLRNKSYNMHIIDEELKKRNILLVTSVTNAKFLGDSEQLAKVTIDDCSRNGSYTTSPNLLSPRSSLRHDEFSSAENTVATISNYRKMEPQDIYDKLDSASDTDSNNSFEIHERKSQVLKITDLTNSLQDLANLDKICRIIEISDELSDKLFANLDKQDSRPRKKKWSFRDLCERIQLDEFCNKVFGKTQYLQE